jgi:transcriptional regulator with XRE-family HTH domain
MLRLYTLMDSKQKQEAKYKLGICINKIISQNKAKNNPNLVVSLRKLAAACDVEYSIIQKITSGKKDPQHTTIMSIVDGLGLSNLEFYSIYDGITDKELTEMTIQNKRSKLKSKSKSSK